MALAFVPAVILLGLFSAWILVRTPWITGLASEPDQPVAFDHRHHVADAGIDCLYCHSDAERGPEAGVPTAAVCMGCHAQIWIDSAELALVRAAASSGRPLRWARVHRLPDFVFFNHAIHLHAGFDCAACHGAVATMPRVRQVEDLSMTWCLDCHRTEPESGTHCTVCHR